MIDSSPSSSSTTYSAALAVGSTVDHYTIKAELGQGGFGITYLITETHSDESKRLALKESMPAHLAIRSADGHTILEQANKQDDYAYATGTFLAEAQTLSQLDHPHIIKVHRAFEENHTVYFTMDYIEGGSLAQENRRRRKLQQGDESSIRRRGKRRSKQRQSYMSYKPYWSESDIIALLHPLLDALEYLHGLDILHRDIKPDNILINLQGQPILIDFGAAKLMVREHTHAQTMVGTAGYCPIEQRGRQGINTGPWSDLYALGATCYYLMTGEPPAMSEDRANQKHDPHVPLTKLAEMSHYSYALRASIDKALQFDFERRWQTAAAWRKQLRTIEVEQQKRSNKLPWIITLLTLSASVGFFLYHRDKLSQPSDSQQQPPPAYTKQLATQAKRIAAQAKRIATLQAQLTAEKNQHQIEKARHQVTQQILNDLKEKHDISSNPLISSSWSYPEAASNAWLAPQGTFIALLSPDKKTVSLYRRTTRTKIGSISHKYSIDHVAFSPDGKLLATAADDHSAKIFDIHQKKTIATIQHDDDVTHVAFSPDSKLLATASRDDSARIYDIHRKENIETSSHAADVTHVSFSPDGKLLATASWDRSSHIVWLNKQKTVYIYHKDRINHAVFSPDSKLLATASEDQTVKIYDIQQEESIVSIFHDAHVVHVAFSPDGKLLATASKDKIVKIFDIQQKQTIATIQHKGWVRAVAFSPDGKFLATRSDDQTSKLWDVPNRSLIDTFKHHERIYDIALAPQPNQSSSQLLRATQKKLHAYLLHSSD